MLSKMFANLRHLAGKFLDSMSENLDVYDREIQKTREDIAHSDRIKKLGLRNHLKTMSNKRQKLNNKIDVMTAVYETFRFMENLCDSFKYQLVPALALAIMLAGSFDDLFTFAVGTVINTIMVFGVLWVIMYATHVRQYVPVINSWNQKTMRICQTIFLAVAIVKLLYTVLTPGWMILVVVVASVFGGLYLARDELKVLLERWKK